MEGLIAASKRMSRYRSFFAESGLEVSLNEAVVLEAVFREMDTRGGISRFVQKDRGYVSRVVKKMMKKGLLEERRERLTLTERGRSERAACIDVLKSFRRYHY